MTIRTIQWPDEREMLLEHIHQLHGPDDTAIIALWYDGFPYFDPRDCFVIDGDHEGEIAGHVMLVPRQIQIGVSVLPVAEIAMLGVLEPYRAQGYTRALMEHVHQAMTERGDVLGLSFGDPELYERWQYEYAVGLYLTSYESDIPVDLALKAGAWDINHSYERRTADRLGAHNQAISVRRFYLNDLPAVQALYRRAAERGHYMLARDEATWRWQLDYLTRIGRNAPDDFLVAEAGNEILAYARVMSQESPNWFQGEDGARFSVIEAAGDHPDATEALLGQIAHTAQAFGVDRVGLFVHPEGRFMQHALAHGAARRQFTGAGFLRLHDLGRALELLHDTLEARRLNSRYATRAYRLIVTTEHDQAELELGMGEADVVALEIPTTALVRLITGWYGIEHVGLGYHERFADLLRVLFPRRDPKIGLADLM
jgi:GNAT superfamily N-acetyltransferase